MCVLSVCDYVRVYLGGVVYSFHACLRGCRHGLYVCVYPRVSRAVDAHVHLCDYAPLPRAFNLHIIVHCLCTYLPTCDHEPLMFALTCM